MGPVQPPKHTRAYPPLDSKEDEVREWHCECGYRVVADDNEQLIQEALLHTYAVHPQGGPHRGAGPADGCGAGFRHGGRRPLK